MNLANAGDEVVQRGFEALTQSTQRGVVGARARIEPIVAGVHSVVEERMKAEQSLDAPTQEYERVVLLIFGLQRGPQLQRDGQPLQSGVTCPRGHVTGTDRDQRPVDARAGVAPLAIAAFSRGL